MPTRDPTGFAGRALQALDALPVNRMRGLVLECDGMSRALSQVLQHVGIDHEIHVGSLEVQGVGEIALHYWIVLADGSHCDMRARVWLGDHPGVPHGVFHPSPAQRYVTRGVEQLVQVPALFCILAMTDLEKFVAGIPQASA